MKLTWIAYGLVTLTMLLFLVNYWLGSERDHTVNTDETVLADKKMQFSQEFQPWYDGVFTEGGFYSTSATLEAIEALQPLAEQLGPDSEEMAKLLYTKSVVLDRGGYKDESWEPGAKSVELDEAAGRLSPTERAIRWYMVSESALAAGEMDKAKDFRQRLLKILDTESTEHSEHVQFIFRRGYGYALHEAGDYADAKTYNMRLLESLNAKDTGPEGLLDLTRERIHLLTNLAQNCHKLEQMQEAENYVLERLKVIRKGQPQNESDELQNLYGREFYELEIQAVFELAVLMQETDRPQLADQYLQEMLQLAEKSEDEYEIDQAKERMEHWNTVRRDTE